VHACVCVWMCCAELQGKLLREMPMVATAEERCDNLIHTPLYMYKIHALVFSGTHPLYAWR
jgi:hypothetical protein